MWWSQIKKGIIVVRNPIEPRSYMNTDTVIDRLDKGNVSNEAVTSIMVVDVAD